jgi:Tol biopolymer transport system component
MTMAPGARLGTYEIVAPLGAGGMGEVYRARDARLNRDVAIKVLPSTVTTDPSRLERFSREARAASALNHPNILTVHELGTHEGQPYIVTELLEGSDLKTLLQGKPLPAKRVVDYSLQLLDGLAAAHDKGIVHRDLKPANLFVTRDGRVKILDFGLAKVRETSDHSMTRQELTDRGVVLGTAGYMAPEQIRGQPADQRSDLFAFGAILYEMLSGQPAFARSTSVETMTAVLNDEPAEFEAAGVPVPPTLERVVRRCLEKTPERRFQSATDLAFAVGTTQSLSDSNVVRVARPAAAGRWRMVAIAGGALALLGVVATATRSWIAAAPERERLMMRLSLPSPSDTAPLHLAVSPDGKWVAFSGVTGPKLQLWVRAIGEPSARLMPGTEGAVLPFWSPDSRAIGYFAAGKLRRVDPVSGVSSPLADVGVATGGAWNREGVIIFGVLGGAGMLKVPAAGGEVQSVMTPDASRQETDFSNPVFLPDGRHFFYYIFSGRREGRGTFLGSLDGGERERVVEDASNVAFADVPGEGTFLFFVRGTALMVQRFDLQSKQVRGEPLPLADTVGMSFDGSGTGVQRRAFSVSQTGLVVFDPVPTRLDSHLFWIDRDGKNERILEDMNRASMVRLSRDGRRFAVGRQEGDRGNTDIWITPEAGGRAERFTFDPANDPFPVWSPDGAQIAWASNRDGIYNIFRKASSGTGLEEVMLTGPGFKLPTEWSPDGKHILYRVVDPVTRYDIWALPTAAGAKPFPVLKTESNEAAAVLSPDSKWIAYGSDETGRYEVYVDTFPPGSGKRQVSAIGGNSPMWRADGRELYFHGADGALMAAAITPGTGTLAGAPVGLFSFAPGGNLVTPYYSVTPDGQRFLLSKLVQHGGETPLTVLVDWPAQLRTRATP